MKPNCARVIIFFFCVSVLSFVVNPAQAQTEFPPAKEIVGKLLDWLGGEYKKDEKYTYKQTVDMEKLDSDGEVEEREKLLYQSEFVDGFDIGGIERCRFLVVPLGLFRQTLLVCGLGQGGVDRRIFFRCEFQGLFILSQGIPVALLSKMDRAEVVVVFP